MNTPKFKPGDKVVRPITQDTGVVVAVHEDLLWVETPYGHRLRQVEDWEHAPVDPVQVLLDAIHNYDTTGEFWNRVIEAANAVKRDRSDK